MPLFLPRRRAVLLLMFAPLLSAALVEGNPDSRVRILVYEDLQCSDCAAFRRMMDTALLPKYGQKVAFEHRDFPLAKHDWSRKAAIAGRYFDSQAPESGVRFRRHIFATQKQITAENLPSHIAAFAGKNDIDPKKALDALQSTELEQVVQADLQDGVARGVAKTPTVFVNGQPFVETFTLEEIAKAIDAELAQ